MDKILGEIQNEYAEIQKARLLMVQSDFARASEIYADILSSMSAVEKEDSLKMSAVYLEYAKCLLLSNDKLVINPELEEDNDYLEDLGIAWELLEIAKSVFKKHNFQNELISVHLLLSDISQESNNFQDALEDLLEAFELIKKQDKSSDKLPDIALRIAFTYEALENKEKAVEMLESIIEMLTSSVQTKDTAEIIEEVRAKINEIKNPEKYKLSMKQEVQHTKIDLNQPVQKIKITKAAKPEEDLQTKREE
ncbi:hypothetical protein NEMIN01_1049 [Nematocida minor]|uniref:uncharacterized protein n=1 Tax=Nematocida minor TaxID=1912983 RepID=UPI00221F14AC|nr:uncharacterized protein NEMIN01_1049 [Nematocida minor]KAI5190425.1 hypothetical protein NEMIN01_1049 [Nematocida minor]